MTKRLMAVFAHPDDEGAIGGTLAHYVQQGVEVMLVCATKGEVGEISDPALARPETLAIIRTKELERACQLYGVQQIEFLGYRDSGMDGTPENEDARCLVQADEAVVQAQLISLMRDFRPNLVVTFEPNGWYGHPDHITVSRLMTEAYPLAADPAVYPELGPAWAPDKFFYAVIRFSKFQALIDAAVAAGEMEEPDFLKSVPEEERMATEAAITHEINVSDQYDRKMQATYAHATQFGEDSFFHKLSGEAARFFWGDESFIEVGAENSAESPREYKDDLFA